ncbi:MAG TPA: hypothetical protein VFE20_00690 [Thermoleophilia bacterium]|nr:hypothetical protein [Thermoleophilia bacterium]
MSLLIAVPLQEGVLLSLATSPGEGGGSPRRGGPRRRVHKMSWGLLAGTSAVSRDRLERLSPADTQSPEEISGSARWLSEPGSEWTFTHEPLYGPPGQELPAAVREGDRLGAPVRLYSFTAGANAGPRLVSWGLLVAPLTMGEELSQEAQLRLQWELERGTGLDERLRAVLAIFNWVGERSEALGPELDVGLHESDRRFTVDRMSWRL